MLQADTADQSEDDCFADSINGKTSAVTTNKKPVIWILFSGSNNFGKVAEKEGYKVLAMDNNVHICKTTGAQVGDVLSFDFRIWVAEHGGPAAIVTSPSCVEWSHAKARALRDPVKGMRPIKRVFELICKYQPKVWIMEQPRNALEQESIITTPHKVAHSDIFYRTLGSNTPQTRFWGVLPPKTGYTSKNNYTWLDRSPRPHD